MNAKGLAFKGYPRNADILLFYNKSHTYTWNRPFAPYDPEYVRKTYRHIEPETGRRYTLGDLTNPNRNRPNLTYEFLGITKVWRWTEERMKRAYEEGRIVQVSPNSVPVQKRYLDEVKGRPVDTIWDDIQSLRASSTERTGYPTQKPLALLERIVAASSNEGDVVLDPFCGCATACVAAERLGRQWVGIDLSRVAYSLVQERLAREVLVGSEETPTLTGWSVTHRKDIPRRTDIDAPVHYRKNKHVLFGKQEGRCGGCEMDFPFKVFEVDHVIPQSKGGTDHIDNLQLLCSHCNRLKGNRDQAYLIARLKEYAHA